MDALGFIAGLAGVITSAKLVKDSLKPKQPRPQVGAVRASRGRVRPTGQQSQPALRLGDPKSKVHRVKNIDQRVSHIVQMIQKGRQDPRVRRIAVQQVSKKCGKTWCIPERDYQGEINALFNHVRRNVRYVRDSYAMDQFQHPVRTFEFAGGDCDDYSITLGSLLQSIGYPVKLRVIQTTDAPDFSHIYLLVGSPPGNRRKYISLDASVAKPAGWEAPKYMIKKVRDYEVR